MWNVANEIQKALLGSKWNLEGDMNNYEKPSFLPTSSTWVELGLYNRYEQRKSMSKIDVSLRN